MAPIQTLLLLINLFEKALYCLARYDVITTCISMFALANCIQGGVINERCYGCGRCVPVCPYDNISQ